MCVVSNICCEPHVNSFIRIKYSLRKLPLRGSYSFFHTFTFAVASRCFFFRTKSPALRRCLQTWYQIPTRLISCKVGTGTKTSGPPRAEVEFDVPHGSHANPGCLYSAWIRSYLLHLLFLIWGMHHLKPLHILWMRRPLWTLCRWALWSKVLILLLAEHLPESMREL